MLTEHFDAQYAYGCILFTTAVLPHEHTKESAYITVQTAETDSERTWMLSLWNQLAGY